MTERGKAFSVLVMDTLAFTVCFAVWMINGARETETTRHMEDLARAMEGLAGKLRKPAWGAT